VVEDPNPLPLKIYYYMIDKREYYLTIYILYNYLVIVGKILAVFLGLITITPPINPLNTE
jgi:hypothetical protein